MIIRELALSLKELRPILNPVSEFDMMKEKFSFLTRVLEVTVTSAKQML